MKNITCMSVGPEEDYDSNSHLYGNPLQIGKTDHRGMVKKLLSSDGDQPGQVSLRGFAMLYFSNQPRQRPIRSTISSWAKNCQPHSHRKFSQLTQRLRQFSFDQKLSNKRPGHQIPTPTQAQALGVQVGDICTAVGGSLALGVIVGLCHVLATKTRKRVVLHTHARAHRNSN